MEKALKKKEKRAEILRMMGKYKAIYIMLIPTLLYFIVFKYLPMFGIVIAFQDFKITRGIFGSELVGLENFIDFLSSYKFWDLIKNTLRLSFMSLVIGFPMPIIFALLLNEVRNAKFKKVVQTISYMPYFISTVVVVSMINIFISSTGILNTAIQALGGEMVNFSVMAEAFPWTYTISGIWQGLGWGSIIYISAIASIDQNLYEAAAIDGANRWQQMLHVTIPCILPTIMIMFILQMGSMLSVGFEKVMLMQNDSIMETADVVSTYVYRRGVVRGDYSYSAAVDIFNAVCNIILLTTANFVSKKLTKNGLW